MIDMFLKEYYKQTAVDVFKFKFHSLNENHKIKNKISKNNKEHLSLKA